MLEKELYPEAKGMHIKIGKLQILKGLWMAKFSVEMSTEIFMDAHSLFGTLDDDYPSYFSCTCELEIGSNYLR